MKLPVNIIRSDTSLWDRFTTRLNKKALPVEPVNLVEISSSLKKNHTKDHHVSIFVARCFGIILPVSKVGFTSTTKEKA